VNDGHISHLQGASQLEQGAPPHSPMPLPCRPTLRAQRLLCLSNPHPQCSFQQAERRLAHQDQQRWSPWHGPGRQAGVQAQQGRHPVAAPEVHTCQSAHQWLRAWHATSGQLQGKPRQCSVGLQGGGPWRMQCNPCAQRRAQLPQEYRGTARSWHRTCSTFGWGRCPLQAPRGSRAQCSSLLERPLPYAMLFIVGLRCTAPMRTVRTPCFDKLLLCCKRSGGGRECTDHRESSG
jgi:hypothetical protein